MKAQRRTRMLVLTLVLNTENKELLKGN